MPHARGEKSSAWNGQAATNQTPNPSQYVLVSFHLISRAIRPLQPTPSGSLFSKIQDKTTPKGRVHFHHDTRPLKTCHRQFFIRTPAPLGSIWQEGSNQKLSMTSDGVVPRWGLVCRGGRVTKRVFNGRVSWWKCTRPFGVVLSWILENKLPLGVGCSGRIARLMRMKWNKDILAWIRSLICGCLAISSWGFFASRMGHPEPAVKPFPFSYSGNSGYKRRLAKRKMVVREANRKKRVKWCKEWRGRTVDNYWKKVLVSDESQVVLVTNNRVYIWRKDDEKYNPHLIQVLAQNGR